MKYCCGMMKSNCEQKCQEHGDHCGDKVMTRWANGTYGLPVHDGGSSIITINFCPWCGTSLKEQQKPQEKESCRACGWAWPFYCCEHIKFMGRK